MMRFAKVRTIATFEFLSTIKRKGYLIATFGMPVFLLAYGAVIGVVMKNVTDKESEVRIYGVVDRAGVLGLEDDLDAPSEIPPEIRRAVEAANGGGGLSASFGWLDNCVFRPFEDEAAGRGALVRREIVTLFVLGADYVRTGKLDNYSSGELILGAKDARSRLERLLQRRLLAGRVPAEIAERSREPITETTSWVVDADGQVSRFNAMERGLSFAVPLVLGLLLIISLVMTSQMMVTGTALEKENKVVEVLLASADPDEILTGKLLGLGLTGLLQMAVWLGMGFAASLIFAASLAAAGFELPWLAIGVALILFVETYLFVGSLMLGTGSLGSNVRESQQFNVVWTLLLFAPLMALSALIADPHGPFGQILSWIPFTAPLTIVMRMTLQPAGIAWWEIAGPILLILACTYGSIRIGARLFRVGLLLGGNRPSLKEILRQARLKA